MLKEIKKDSVALLMPCGAPVEPRVIQSALNLVTTACVNGCVVRQVGVTDRTLIQTARNFLAKGFMEETECEWSFWMDSDMILEARTILVMLRWAKQLNIKMLTGIYYQRGGKHKPNLWKREVRSKDGRFNHIAKDDYSQFFVYPKEHRGPPYPVDAAGFGCVLVHRDVFADLKFPYFKFVWYPGEDGKEHEVSEDFYFFGEAAKAGHQLYAVPELNCGHLGSAPVIEHKDMSVDRAELTEMKMDKEVVKV